MLESPQNSQYIYEELSPWNTVDDSSDKTDSGDELQTGSGNKRRRGSSAKSRNSSNKTRRSGPLPRQTKKQSRVPIGGNVSEMSSRNQRRIAASLDHIGLLSHQGADIFAKHLRRCCRFHHKGGHHYSQHHYRDMGLGVSSLLCVQS